MSRKLIITLALFIFSGSVFSKSNIFVKVKVFDITGRLVSVIANNELAPAGTSEVKFNASNLASGIYFYNLTAGSFNETKKMILVK